MKLPLQIVFRDIVPLPSLEPEIRRLAAKLDQWTPDVMSCHVAVESAANRRHPLPVQHVPREGPRTQR